jgi:c-di-GMP-binding flagellar brake protein YcgR
MKIPVSDTGGPNESKQQEKRQHPRIKVAVPAEIHVEGASGPLSVQTADLSMGGLYVEMMFTLAVGTKLKTVLRINDVEVSTGGIVVTRDIQVGNGIKFTDMTPENRERLKNFLIAEAASKDKDTRKDQKT